MISCQLSINRRNFVYAIPFSGTSSHRCIGILHYVYACLSDFHLLPNLIIVRCSVLNMVAFSAQRYAQCAWTYAICTKCPFVRPLYEIIGP